MNKYTCLLRLNSLFHDKEWRFAKTMPTNPHWYTLANTWESREEFEEAARLIREFGYKVKFGRSWYTLFNVANYFYWTMGAALSKTTLINRAFIDKNQPHPYDEIAGNYDSFFADEESKEQDRQVAKMLGAWLEGSILDVGCGTGLLLELLDIEPDNYLGIDPSRAMIEKLQQSHPAHPSLHCYYEDLPSQGFDRIVSLYGSFGYVDPSYTPRLLSQLNAGGEYMIMLLADGYRPVTHQKSGVDIPYYSLSEYELPPGARVQPFYDYAIVWGKK